MFKLIVDLCLGRNKTAKSQDGSTAFPVLPSADEPPSAKKRVSHLAKDTRETNGLRSNHLLVNSILIGSF